MNTITDHSERASLKQLKKSIKKLIGEYKYTHKLLSNQLKAVIAHDISSLNELIEEQVKAYDHLQKSEKSFKNHLRAFHHQSSRQNATLGNVVNHLEKPSNTLNRLRERLKKQVEKTEKLRKRLMDLLEFAQQENNATFKAILDLASADSENYNEDGNKHPQITNSLTINQRA